MSPEFIKDDPGETAQRKSQICFGCRGEKEIGLLVCWYCFKHRIDIKPLKYYESDFNSWMKLVAETRKG